MVVHRWTQDLLMFLALERGEQMAGHPEFNPPSTALRMSDLVRGRCLIKWANSTGFAVGELMLHTGPDGPDRIMRFRLAALGTPLDPQSYPIQLSTASFTLTTVVTGPDCVSIMSGGSIATAATGTIVFNAVVWVPYAGPNMTTTLIPTWSTSDRTTTVVAVLLATRYIAGRPFKWGHHSRRQCCLR